MKYLATTVNVVFSFNSAFTVTKNSNQAQQELVDLVGNGYEIVSAVPVASESITLIQYILRKEVKE